jgi:L-alanine-DL-glutamate epimerase-like enolase superfamily enzyme
VGSLEGIDMKITQAEAILVSIPFAGSGTPPWSFGGRPANAFDILLVRLETESGLVGWGEAFSRNRDSAQCGLLQSRLLPLVIGKNAFEISKIKHDLEFRLHNFGRTGALHYGISAIDIALWDLLGKACGRPLCDLLGGRFADEIEVYASLMRYGTAEGVVSATKDAIRRGYHFIKLHEVEIEPIRAAVAAAGGKAKMMLDTNCPWSVPDALRRDAELADLDLYWLEEPVWPPENYQGLAKVRSAGHHRIAAGENAGSLHDFVSMIEAGAIDIAQPDVAKSGGITEVMRIATLCEAHGIEFVPHCALFGPGQVATLHIHAAQRSVPIFERLFCDFAAEIYGGATIPKEGFIRVPNGAGLGLDPDPKVIEQYRVPTAGVPRNG